MKAALLLGVLLGFGSVLAAAHLYPWVEHPRLPSRTTVVANGGRAERFVIHLPVDRIHSVGAAAGLRAAALPLGSELAPELAAAPLLAEHFKLRDAGGQVIGLAARHWTDADGGAHAAWAVLIPGRGSLLMTGSGEQRRRIDIALERAGYRAGAGWTGDLSISLADSASPGQIIGGSDEFEGLGGTYAETWKVTGVGSTGELRGTVELDTVTLRSAAR